MAAAHPRNDTPGRFSKICTVREIDAHKNIQHANKEERHIRTYRQAGKLIIQRQSPGSIEKGIEQESCDEKIPMLRIRQVVSVAVIEDDKAQAYEEAYRCRI